MKKESVYKIFSDMPTLTTERLRLRPMHVTDAQDMFDYAKRPSVTAFLLWDPHPNISYTRDYLRYIESRYSLGDFYDWAIVELESGRMIGTCGFARINTDHDSAEIGYVLHPDFWGRGYAAEAAASVIEFGFSQLGLHRIEARFMKGNEPSLRVMEKLGMTFEGYHTDEIFVKGSYRTVGTCAVIAESLQKSKKKAKFIDKLE